MCCGAALINACRLTGRRVEDIRMVVNGCGAAAIAVTKVPDVPRRAAYHDGGALWHRLRRDERLNPAQAEMAS